MSRGTRRAVIGIGLTLLSVVVLGVTIISLHRSAQVQTSYASTQTNTSTPARQSPNDTMRRYLRTINPDVRSTAIEILHSYLREHYDVAEKTVYVSAGDWEWLRFEYFYPYTYELTISVSGSCVGQCDIKVELLDSSLRTINYLGRVTYLRENLTILRSFGVISSSIDNTYYLKLDNTYSMFTSKKSM